jgi:hypothetical protein
MAVDLDSQQLTDVSILRGLGVVVLPRIRVHQAFSRPVITPRLLEPPPVQRVPGVNSLRLCSCRGLSWYRPAEAPSSPRGAAVLAASCVAPRHCQRSRARWTASQGIARSPWPPLTAAEVRHVVDSLAAQRGLPLSAETARLIAERSGGDLGVVQGLLTQLGAAMRWPTKDAAAAALVRLYSTRVVWIAEAASTRIPGSRGPHPVRSDGRAQTTRTEAQAPADSANPHGVGDGGACIAPVCRTPHPAGNRAFHDGPAVAPDDGTMISCRGLMT